MPTPPSAQSSPTPTRDRDAYFAAASELLLGGGCEAVTIAALCDRLGVTKGSFYHHFADMPGFVAAFAESWQESTIRRARDYAAIGDPLLRIEAMQNDLPEVFFGPDQAIRVWGRNDPALAAVLENVQKPLEGLISQAMGEIFGNPELGALWARMAYRIAVGLQLRLEPIDPERYLMAVCELAPRLGIGVELVHVDGRLRTKLTHAVAFEADAGRRRPDLTGLATRPSNASAGGPAGRPGPRDRDAFFGAAWELLAQRGFDGVTLLAMCDRLSVTKGSFRHHFGGMPRFVAALAADWERRSMARLDVCRAQVDPTVRLARLLQQFLGGPDPAGSAWRAWGHVEPVLGQALKRVDRSHQDLLSETLAMLWGDPHAADLMAEITLALLIGLKQPRPEVGLEEAAWMALEWARRLLRVEADLHLDRGEIVLVMRNHRPV